MTKIATKHECGICGKLGASFLASVNFDSFLTNIIFFCQKSAAFAAFRASLYILSRTRTFIFVDININKHALYQQLGKTQQQMPQMPH